MNTLTSESSESLRKSAVCRAAKVLACVLGSVTLLIVALLLVWIGWILMDIALGNDSWGHDETEWSVPLRYNLEWSPSGEYIVFADNWNTLSVSADGTALHFLQGEGRRDDFSISISPDGSRVAYSTTRYPRDVDLALGINSEIETSRLDGSDTRRLTKTEMDDIYPVWSPDGGRFVVMRSGDNDEGVSGLYTMSADGSDLQLLLPLPYHVAPSDEPENGSRMPKLARRPLGDLPQRDHGGPLWSPSGDMLAFSGTLLSWQPKAHSIYVINSDGTGLSIVFSASGVTERDYSDSSSLLYVADPIIGTPAWSPDGRMITFMRYIEDDYRGLTSMGEYYAIKGEPGLALYAVSVDGTGFREVVKFGPRFACDGAVTWSPDGAAILTSYFQPQDARFRVCGNRNPDSDQGYVYVVDANSGNAQRIGEGAHAVWSPDGSRVAVFNPFSDGVLYTANPDGSGVHVLVRRKDDGELVAANRRCVLFFCWSVDPSGDGG